MAVWSRKGGVAGGGGDAPVEISLLSLLASASHTRLEEEVVSKELRRRRAMASESYATATATTTTTRSGNDD